MNHRQTTGVTRQAVYDFIVDFKRQHDGVAPTLREISQGVGINSTSGASGHLAMLEQEGKITRPFGVDSSRNIVVVGGRWCGPGE